MVLFERPWFRRRFGQLSLDMVVSFDFRNPINTKTLQVLFDSSGKSHFWPRTRETNGSFVQTRQDLRLSHADLCCEPQQGCNQSCCMSSIRFSHPEAVIAGHWFILKQAILDQNAMEWNAMRLDGNVLKHVKTTWKHIGDVVRLPPLAGVCPTSSSSRMFCSHPQNTSAPLRVFAVPLVPPCTVFRCFLYPLRCFKNVESSTVHWIQAMGVDLGGSFMKPH